MSKCKNCIHFPLCRELRNLSVQGCGHFKSNTELSGLPCRVGDYVYELSIINGYLDYQISRLKVERFIIEKNDRLIIDTNGVAFDSKLLGESFFLSRDEAEKKLKERAENA